MRKFRLSRLKRRLLAVVAVALLPVVLLAVVGVSLLARQDYEQAQRTSIERVRAISSAVDAELSRSIAAMTVLSNSSSLLEENFARFYRLCARVREQQPSWAT